MFFGEKSVIFGSLFKKSRKVFEKYKPPEDGSFALKRKKKKVISYTSGVFALNKTLGFLVLAEERDKAALKNYQNKVYFRCKCFQYDFWQ